MSANKIREAALARFAREGYNVASLAEIAGDVGIRKPSIYAHFASKKQLFLDLLADACAREQACIARLADARDLNELRTYIFHILARFGENDYLRLWLRAIYLPPLELAAEIENYDAQYAGSMDAALASALRTAAPRLPGADSEMFAEAYSGIVRAIHAELLYHGIDRSRLKAEAMWKVFELALAGLSQSGRLPGAP